MKTFLWHRFQSQLFDGFDQSLDQDVLLEFCPDWVPSLDQVAFRLNKVQEQGNIIQEDGKVSHDGTSSTRKRADVLKEADEESRANVFTRAEEMILCSIEYVSKWLHLCHDLTGLLCCGRRTW